MVAGAHLPVTLWVHICADPVGFWLRRFRYGWVDLPPFGLSQAIAEAGSLVFLAF